MKNRVFRFSVLVITVVLVFIACVDDTEKESPFYKRIVTVDSSLGGIRLLPDLEDYALFPEKVTPTIASQFSSNKRAFITYKYLDVELADNKEVPIELVDEGCFEFPINEFSLRPDTLNSYTDFALDFSIFAVDYYTRYPFLWVSKGFLNVTFDYESAEKAQIAIVPIKVSNDTLYTEMKIKSGKGSDYWLECITLDIRSLNKETSNTVFNAKRKEMVKKINAIRMRKDAMFLTLTLPIENNKKKIETTKFALDFGL